MAKIEVYTTQTCPYCVQIKEFLKRKGYEYKEIRVDLDDARRAEMLDLTGGIRTVPQVMVNGVHVGDEDTLFAADKVGTLDRILGPA
jgi:glutaredoxin 3